MGLDQHLCVVIGGKDVEIEEWHKAYVIHDWLNARTGPECEVSKETLAELLSLCKIILDIIDNEQDKWEQQDCLTGWRNGEPVLQKINCLKPFVIEKIKGLLPDDSRENGYAEWGYVNHLRQTVEKLERVLSTVDFNAVQLTYWGV